MPSVPIKALNATHPSYHDDDLAQFEALYEGGRCWREMIGHWIPQNAQEPDELWVERKNRATYDNHAGPITDLIVAWLFSKPPTVQGFDADWEKNVDKQGTALAPWLRQVVTDALKCRRAYVWVNLPKRPDGVAVTNRADEEALKLHIPFLVDLKASEVRDWGEDEHGNLAWILVRREVCERTSVTDGRGKKWRWMWIDAVRIQVWEWTPTKDSPTFPDEAEAAQVADIAHGFGRMPVARIQLPAGLHVLEKLRDPAVGLMRLANDLDWSLHRWANSLLVISTADTSKAPSLGAGYYLRIGKEDKAYTVAPDASGFAAMAERLKDKREEVYRVVQQMAAGVSGDSVKQAASGVAKTLDWQSLQVMLAAYADIVKVVLVQVLALAGVPLRIPAERVVVGGLEGWQEDDLATILADFLTAQPFVKSETFRRLLAKEAVKRMLPEGTDEATKKAINEEIDNADYGEPEILAPPRPLGKPPKPEDERESAAA
jgi:hypothetical protein